MSDDNNERGEVVGRAIANPLGEQEASPQYAGGGGLISVEQQRAVAEVQARMMIARANPRDPIRCTDLILQDCTRQTLAEGALYQYARGGSSVSGPSIRLAETLARRWGNIASGIKELSRQNGYSECVAYAWDLETGYYDERQFQVRHWRDTRKGGYQITDERDIYEMIANMGQRRKRAVLLTVIPGDIVEAAVSQCEETLRTSADTSPEALKKMVQFFAAYGVTQQQIEARCQCHLEAIRPAQVVQLRKIYASLKDGMSDPDDWFPPSTEQTGAPRRNLDKFEDRHAKPSAPELANEIVGIDQPLFDAGGNAAEQGTEALEAWWLSLTSSQRGYLGAKGRSKGPHYAAWAERAAQEPGLHSGADATTGREVMPDEPDEPAGPRADTSVPPVTGATDLLGDPIMSERDPAFWDNPDGRIIYGSVDDFIQEVPMRLVECRTNAEIDDIARHNKASIDALNPDDRAAVSKWFTQRREEVRG